MLVLLVIVVLIILSLMFGGFQKGTKSGGLGQYRGPGPSVAVCAACTSAYAGLWLDDALRPGSGLDDVLRLDERTRAWLRS